MADRTKSPRSGRFRVRIPLLTMVYDMKVPSEVSLRLPFYGGFMQIQSIGQDVKKEGSGEVRTRDLLRVKQT